MARNTTAIVTNISACLDIAKMEFMGWRISSAVLIAWPSGIAQLQVHDVNDISQIRNDK